MLPKPPDKDIGFLRQKQEEAVGELKKRLLGRKGEGKTKTELG